MSAKKPRPNRSHAAELPNSASAPPDSASPDQAPAPQTPTNTGSESLTASREPAPAVGDEARIPDEPPDDCSGAQFPVIAVGASAGGLEALTELLKYLPTDTGAALVFVQHLDPHHKSSLVEILARATRMPVVEITDGLPMEPDHVYVMPADRDVAVLHGVLHLMTRPRGPELHLPIDYFFRSLAQDQGNRAVGIVLSGTGSDGTSGLRAIKAEGGITFAQKPESAKYTGMPLSASATGQVDFVLSPREIAGELAHIARHPYIEGRRRTAPQDPSLGPPEALQKIFIVLRRATGVDFAHYKQSTVQRRLSRRMALHKLDSIGQYLKFLEQTPSEVGLLFEDMLINVTGFFREPEAFEALTVKVFPRIFADGRQDAAVRVWVPACSTGEEAYSLAIALTEYMQAHEIVRPVQIFATDVSDAAIERARGGRYLDNIAESVSPERLRRFFQKSSVGYQVAKPIRDLCVFAKQNVTRDPPFSNLDLLSCRNLLIYMGPVFQKRIIPAFHYALAPTGFLMLGQSETIGGFADLFSLVDRVHKVYAKKVTSTRHPLDFVSTEFRAKPELAAKPVVALPGSQFDLQREADRILLNAYAPPGVIVNREMEILHFRGQTGQFLAPAPGAATLNLLKMAREGLSLDLRAVIHQALKKGAPVRKEGLRCRSNDGVLELAVEVIPIQPSGSPDTYCLVLFQEAHPAPAVKARSATRRSPSQREADQEAQRLRDELAQTKEMLRQIIEDHETSNEEIRAANEEIQSANEELQSTNEELETAKEELQSTNEELSTLNGELENQNLELNRAVDDFNNLHNSVNIPVLLLGTDLRIRAFMPPAERSLRLIPADSGRPLNELKLGIQVVDLERKVIEVIENLRTWEEEVQDYDGHWYLMRIRPYRTSDNRITGAVLVLIDIHQRKVAEQVFHYVVDTVHEPLVVLNSDLTVRLANPAFYRAFAVTPSDTMARPLYELGNGQWNIPRLRTLLEEIVPRNAKFDDYLVEHEFPGVGRRKIMLNARRIVQSADRPPLILLALEDVTDAPPRAV